MRTLFFSRCQPPGMLLLLLVCFPAAFHPKGSSKKQADTVSVSTLGGARTPSLLLEGKEGTTRQKGDQGETEIPIHPLGSEHRWHRIQR